MALPSQSFGNRATNLKLGKLAEYLDRYTTALQKQPNEFRPFKKIYFDAFAGNGGIDIEGQSMPLFDVFESGQFIKGSARRALELRIPFDEYVFVEKSKAKADELRSMVVTDYPQLADRVHIRVGDANDELLDFCMHTDWHTRNMRQCSISCILGPFR